MIPFLHLGPLTIPTYGLMVASGMLVAYYLLRADLSRRNIRLEAELMIAVPCLAGIIGAKVYFVLETPRDFFAHPVDMLFDRYGLTWSGGLIAGVVAYVLLARRAKVPLLLALDAAGPALAIGYGFGRLGCLLSGDGDYGTPTSLPWGMSFPNGLVPTTQRVHPTPIYEFLAACAIGAILWQLGARQVAGSDRTANVSQLAAHVQLRPGAVFATYLITTGLARFLVEFIRLNPRVIWGLTNAQVVSLSSTLVGLLLWLLTQRD